MKTYWTEENVMTAEVFSKSEGEMSSAWNLEDVLHTHDVLIWEVLT